MLQEGGQSSSFAKKCNDDDADDVDGDADDDDVGGWLGGRGRGRMC